MVILKEKWLRDKAKQVLDICDSPITKYNPYDYNLAAYDKFKDSLSNGTIQIIINKILELEKQKQRKVI